MALIELKDVTKKYDKSTTALRHIDLSVNSGEFVYLVGPSGAGKSSLILPRRKINEWLYEGWRV